MTLPNELIARLRERIAQPARRTDHSADRAGAVELPINEIREKFEANAPGSSDGLDLMKQKMADWGFNLESMNFVDLGGGHLSAFSEDPNQPLAAPPGGDALDAAEATLQIELPEDLRSLYTLADGGFGPGLGLKTVQGVVASYQDMCRRGPDYTGEVEWPRHLLPLFDAAMVPGLHGFDEARTLSIDTQSGVIMTFNEDWDQDDLTPETAWSEVAPSLRELLERWLGTVS